MGEIEITFPDKNKQSFRRGTTPLAIAEGISSSLARQVVVASVNGELWDVHRPIDQDATLSLHKWESDEGKHAFWHSSAHLLAAAVEELYPGTKFWVGPALETGFYYDVALPKGTTISEKDLERIEQKILELAAQNSPFCRKELSKAKAVGTFTEKDDKYKIDLLERLEDGEISLYSVGRFTDLCRGPHLKDTSTIKAVKLTAVAGAYWKGDENNEMLTRIYGIAFPKKKMLDEHLAMLEEAKQRDHRKIGKEQGLFCFSTEVGQGLPLWLPRGVKLREALEQFLKKVQKDYGYQQVITPHIGSIELYKLSGHYEKYGKDSFRPINTPVEGEAYLLKPMNCPHHVEIYKSTQHSYRDLPIRMAEFGTVYRYEQSGELHGLTRVRSFTQDDAHIFCTAQQLKEEFIRVIDIVFIIFNALSLKDFTTQISLRDKGDSEKYIGKEEHWELAEKAIIEACQEKKLEAVQIEGEAAFYGPKLDFMVKDALGRKWQLGTIQVDYNLPERFGLEYIGEDGDKHRPIMIHRAPFGSMERFTALLIEHTAGKFPLWLAPEQVVVLPISEKYQEYAEKVCALLNNSDIRSEIDGTNERIGKKIRNYEVKHVPYIVIVGENEQTLNSISVRQHGKGDLGSMKIEQFLSLLHRELQVNLDTKNI